jgi:hypothetical protein
MERYLFQQILARKLLTFVPFSNKLFHHFLMISNPLPLLHGAGSTMDTYISLIWELSTIDSTHATTYQWKEHGDYISC